MNPMNIVKPVADIVVSMGVGAIISNAVKATTPADVKTYQKITITVGTVVLSGFVSAMASKHTTDQIESTAEQFKELKQNLKTN